MSQRWGAVHLDLFDRGDVHSRREGIVRALRLVHIIVRLHRLLETDDAACHLDSPIGTLELTSLTFILLRATARLLNIQRKVGVEFAAYHLVGD